MNRRFSARCKGNDLLWGPALTRRWAGLLRRFRLDHRCVIPVPQLNGRVFPPTGLPLLCYFRPYLLVAVFSHLKQLLPFGSWATGVADAGVGSHCPPRTLVEELSRF